MPGLVAIISSNPPETIESDVQLMRDSMRHEPYYSSGYHAEPSVGVFVGWACHPGSYCDCLPIKNEREDLLLFFYGEHHSDEPNHRSTQTDARSLVDLYEQNPTTFLSRLNGWFHGIVIDKQRAQVVVFNDRLGMQRLYYHEDGSSILFASEAKALLKVRRSLRNLDPEGLGDLLSCGAVLENRTLFPGILTLPAASAWQFQRGRLAERARYFRPEEWENQPPLPQAEFEGQLGALMPRLLARHSRSRLPLAVSLTGGYDTRLIMAYLDREQTSGRSYTFGGIYRDCFDVKIARQVAAECGYSHDVLALDDTFFKTFPSLAEKTILLSDGNLGACNAYELYLNKRARAIAPLKLTGSFGSEVMRGARAFKATACTPGLLQPEFTRQVAGSVERFATINRGHGISFSVFKHAPWYYYNRLAIEQSQLVVRTPFLDNELLALMYQARDYKGDRRDLARRLISRGRAGLAAMPTDTGNTSWLRHRVQHFLFQADYCYKSGMPQWLEQLHYLCGPIRPERLFIGLHRFQHFRVWFRHQLASYVREMLLDPRTLQRPYFNRRFLEFMVARHLKGDRNYTDDIEKVLTLELTHRTLIDAA